jgi:hypothetical protein
VIVGKREAVDRSMALGLTEIPGGPDPDLEAQPHTTSP